jgi:ADP-heptose:LPS heptosyltransferase
MNSLFRDYEIVARSGLFDPKHYLATYPDVARRNIDPLMHYLEEGARAVRNPHPDFDAEFYLAQCRLHGHKPENSLLHYLTVGIDLGFKTKPDDEVQLFDVSQPNEVDEPAKAQVFLRPPMLLYIDDVDVAQDGVLRVEGWVVCLAPITSVEVLLDATSLGVAEHGRPRGDVAKTRSTYPNASQSGFLFIGDVSPFGAGPKTVTVRTTAQTGIVRELVRTLDVPELQRSAPANEEPVRYHCDRVLLTTAGRLSLAGWIACSAPTTTIDVLVDGTKVGVAQFGIDRGDVGNLFPSLPHARVSGFAVNCRAKPPLLGEHRVTLRVHRSDDRVEDIVLPILDVESDPEPAVTVASVDAPSTRALHLDAPVLLDSTMETPVRGKLEVSGWALARAGVAAIDIVIDEVVLMTAEYGLRRRDVQSAFPDWGNALDSGFLALLPHRLLPRGRHQVSVVLRDEAGGNSSIDFRIVVEPLPDTAGPWALRRRMPAAELDLGQRLLARQEWRPVFQVLMAVPRGTSLDDVRRTVSSLNAQVYADWRLALLWEPPAGDRFGVELATLGEKCRLVADFSPGDTWDDASFLVVLTPGTELGCDAFHEMALVTAAHRDADFLYSDERRLNPGTGEIEAFFKPQWSPDLLLSTNYVGQLWCARADLVRRVLTAAEDLLLQGGYDLVLRLTEAAQRLRDRLVPERFDLAIDLRKHLETRPLLQNTGARYLAGTDYRNRFPWLDVAIEWEGDPAYIHKRRHNADDLINLVDAVAAACEIDRSLIASAPADPSPEVDEILARVGGHRLVCLHPTAGNDMKQWPVAYFAAVADRLVENNDARIIVIGGPGEETVGVELLRQMRHADAAVSVIGQIPLGGLPALLTRCSLFLGNDSGPKHIAAGLGVPTVAVQSGSVDVHEWGPIGPHAVAVVRDVTCAPCYLPKPEDCRRGLACLKQLSPDAVYAACSRLLLTAKHEMSRGS